VFWTPLAARYHIENAFGLPYIGVHALCLYAGLGVFALTSYPTYWWIWKENSSGRNDRIEKALTNATMLAVFGCALKLFSFFNSNDNGIFLFYALGQVIVSISISIIFNLGILANKYMHRDVYGMIDTFGASIIGLTIATILVHAVFLDSDKFFTKVQRVQTKNFYIMVG
jgi:hypothetical protein